MKPKVIKKLNEKLIHAKIQITFDTYIINNINTLEKWCGKKYDKVLYDSDVDSKDIEIFHTMIMEHRHLYFIIIDSNYNIFGHYCSNGMERINYDIYDDDHFFFTLYSNERIGLMKYEHSIKKDNDNCMRLSEDYYYECGQKHNLRIHSFIPNASEMKNINEIYDNIHSNEIIRSDISLIQFTTMRLVVIQMKEEEKEKQTRLKKEEEIRTHNNSFYNDYVKNNKKLKEWCKMDDMNLLYDSDNDNKDSSIFRDKIVNQKTLIFHCNG